MVSWRRWNPLGRTNGKKKGTDGMDLDTNSCNMTLACGRFFVGPSRKNRSVVKAVRLLVRPDRGVGGNPRNRSIVGSKSIWAEPLRDGDAKLPALTAFEQRVAGLPISTALIALSSTGTVPILRNKSP